MKKIAILSLTFLAAHLSAFATPNLKVINVFDLAETELSEIMQGDHPDVAVEFSAQTTLPITFFLRGDLVNFIENDEKFGLIEVKQTFYARYVQEELIFSTDLIDWKPFLEFATGTASVALGTQDGQPSITVGAEANCRS